MAVPYTFGSATSAIPLSQLDSNFATAITLGSTALTLGTTTTTVAGLTLTSPTLTTPALGTPSSGVLTNCTGYPSSAISGTISLTTQVTGTLPVANGGTGVTTSTGTGSVVLSTSPTLVTPALGTPSSVTLTNATGLPISTGLSGLTTNGVAYATSTTALATGSALTFNGTNLGIGGNPLSTGIDTGSTNLFSVAPNSNFGAALTTVADSVGRNYAFSDATKTYKGFLDIGSTGIAFGSSSSIPVNFYTSGSKRMTLDTSGNLGLGVTPSVWSTYQAIQLSSQASLSSTGGVFNIGANVYYGSGGYTYIANGEATLYQQNAGGHNWRTAASGTAGNAISFTQAMTLNSSGQLLVGTSSAFNSAYTMSLAVVSATGGLIIQPGANGYTAIQFNNASGSGVGGISCSSTTTTYGITSDQRLKTNIVDAPDGNIDQIKIRSFDWKSTGEHSVYGVIAQELVEVAPYAVHQPENSDEMMGVDYSKLVPMMVKEIQSLKAEVAKLKGV
jgi:hypothetical protein